jgi:iron complex transport system substrate-binding protein
MSKRLLATFLLAMASCGRGGNQEPPKLQSTQQITDQLGRKVELTTRPSRVVSGSFMPFASIWYTAMHSTDALIGMHPSSLQAARTSMIAQMSPQILNASVKFLDNGETNIEELLKLQPDVFFEIATLSKSIDKLAEVGIPVVALETIPKTVADDPFASFVTWLELAEQVAGVEGFSQQFVKMAGQTRSEIVAKVVTVAADDRPRVLFLQAHDGKIMRVTGGQLFGTRWIDFAGGVDVSHEDVQGHQQPVNMEQIYRWNPDVIIYNSQSPYTPEQFVSNSIEGQDWSPIKAVQAGRVYRLPQGVFRWSAPTGDGPIMLKWMAQTLHPQLFSYDLAAEVKQYYQEFFRYSLSEQQVADILNPPLPRA